MKTKNNFIIDPMWSYSANKRRESKKAEAISKMRINFLDGEAIRNVNYLEESSETRSKVRRIIEKRVCQKLHTGASGFEGNMLRYRERHLSSRQASRSCGPMPYAFSA